MIEALRNKKLFIVNNQISSKFNDFTETHGKPGNDCESVR